jgi:hypothetical protein
MKHIQQRRFAIGRKPQTNYLTANGVAEFVEFICKDQNMANYTVATQDNMDHSTGVEQATEQWMMSHDTGRQFEFDVSSEQLGRILYLVFGSVVTTTPEPIDAPTMRQHVFSMMDASVSRQLPATSLVEQLAGAINRLLPSMVAESFGLSGDAINRISGTVGLRGSGKYTTPSGVTIPGPLAAPAAPTVTPQGAAGVTAYSYFVVAKDGNGKRSLVSPVGTTNTGNAVLDGVNFNRVTWVAVPGAVSYDVLKTNTNTFLGSTSALQLDDTGQATAVYTPPTANETAGFLNYFYNSQVSLAVDDAGVITNYGNEKRINSWEWGATNELLADDGYRPGAALFQTADDPASGALRSECLFGKRGFTMGYNVRLNSESEELAALRAQKLLKPTIDLTGPKIGATAFNHKLTIVGEKSPYEAVELGNRNGIVTLGLRPKMLYDVALGKIVTVTLINEVPSYTT